MGKVNYTENNCDPVGAMQDFSTSCLLLPAMRQGHTGTSTCMLPLERKTKTRKMISLFGKLQLVRSAPVDSTMNL